MAETGEDATNAGSARVSRRRLLQTALGAAAAMGAGGLAREPIVDAQSASWRKIVFPWLSLGDSAGFASLRQHASHITHLSPSWYNMGLDLAILGRADVRVTSFARQHRMPLHPVIQNAGFDPNVAAQILATAQSRAQAATNIAQLVLHEDYEGINLDFEGTFGASRDQYSDFVARLARQLHPNGRWVTVDVVPRTGAAANAWAAPYDYAALAEVCNAVMLMAYAYSGNRPGPIAPLWWVQHVVKYAGTQIPARKLVVGLPFYGLHCTTRNGETSMRDVRQAQAQALLHRTRARLERPMPDATPRFAWQDAAGAHVVHFEDLQSLSAKLCTLRAANVAGIAFWRLGQEEWTQWEAVAGWVESWI